MAGTSAFPIPDRTTLTGFIGAGLTEDDPRFQLTCTIPSEEWMSRGQAATKAYRARNADMSDADIFGRVVQDVFRDLAFAAFRQAMD